MSNEITIAPDLTFSRTSKSGKVTTRGALGALMSGNVRERATLSLISARGLIDNNTFGPVMNEVARVFTPKSLAKHGVFAVGDGFAFFVNKTIVAVDGRWDATLAKLYCEAVGARCSALDDAGKEIKGEKNTAAIMAEYVVAHCKAKAVAKVPATKVEAPKAAAIEATPA